MRFHHVCEVCGLDEILAADEAYASGWDYPPTMGHFGIISPRTCPKCPISQSVWWAIEADGYVQDMLTNQQRRVIDRILTEPESLAVLTDNAQ